MKNYHDVVKDRFDSEQDIASSIYSPSHPVGKYVRKILFEGLDRFLETYSPDKDKLKAKTMLDVGCGDGGMIDYFISRGFLPENTVGVDLSEGRIKRAQQKSKGSTFIQGDALTYDLKDQKFDLITSFDLFSHLTTQDQIIEGLSNIHKHLQDDGVFLWYDIYSKDHFEPKGHSDSWGFSKKQMAEMAEEAGFEVHYHKTFFKLFFNRYHSIYQVKRLSPGIVRFLEVVLPGKPGNLMFVFKKKDR